MGSERRRSSLLRGSILSEKIARDGGSGFDRQLKPGEVTDNESVATGHRTSSSN